MEVTTSIQHFKYGIEIRIESVNQDNSHSWVRISDGTVKYVNDSIEDDTENLADSQEEESVPTSSSVVEKDVVTLDEEKGEVTFVNEGHDVERVTAFLKDP